jgi:hypothetical protein
MFVNFKNKIQPKRCSSRFYLLSAFVAGYLVHWIVIPGFSHALDLSLDLDEIEPEKQLQAVFHNFLEIERDTFRDGPFPIRDGWKYELYTAYTAKFNTYLRERAEEEHYAVFAQELQDLEELERIAKVLEEINWSCDGGNNQRRFDALTTDLQLALLERVAALEVLRFIFDDYSAAMLAESLDHNNIEMAGWRLIVDDFDGRRSLPGRVNRLFEDRVVGHWFSDT